MDLYFVTTRNCNFACSHCYMEGAPGQEDTTISEDNFKRVIDNISSSSGKLMLTGGEVFTIEDKLFSFLDYIRMANEKREKYHKIIPAVQTNGLWAQNGSEEKILEKLADFGVRRLDITSNDRFHERQGINRKRMRQLSAIAGRYMENVSLRGADNPKNIMPIGRAKRAANKNNRANYFSCSDYLDKESMTIDENGDVYACCFHFFKLPGNLTREPLSEIVKSAKKDKRLTALSTGGVEELAEIDGLPWKKVSETVRDKGRCGTCAEFYSNEGKYA